MWARLSVFSGGFDLEGAEEVCSGDEIVRDDVLSLVAGLVNKSIVVRHQATEHTTAWYQMLESIRQYGAGAAHRPGRRRERCGCGTATTTAPWRSRFAAEGFGPRQADWFIRLRRESGNLRAALEFCLADTGRGRRRRSRSPRRSGTSGSRGSCARATATCGGRSSWPPNRPAARAYGLWAASYLAMFATDFERNATMLAECTEIAAGLDDDLLEARIKECRGQATLYQGDLPGADRAAGAGPPRVPGDRRPARRVRHVDPAHRLHLLPRRPSRRRVQPAGPRAGGAPRRAVVDGLRTLERRHRAVARRRLRAGRRIRCGESIRLFQPMHDLTGISFGVQALSWCAAFADPGERAARLLGAAQAVWRTSGAKVDETNAYSVFDARSEDALREAMSSGAFESDLFQRAIAEGASYSFEQAVALALGEDGDAAGQRGGPHHGRTGRGEARRADAARVGDRRSC